MAIRATLRLIFALLLSAQVLAPAYTHAQAINLLDAYLLAENNSPQLAAAREERAARLEQVPQARSQLFPQINAAASGRYHYEDVTINEPPEFQGMEGGLPFGSMGGEQEYTTTSLSLEMSQAIYRREAFIALRQARTVEDQAELEFELARQDLAQAVAEAYFAVLEADDAVQSFEAEQRTVARELERAERRRELGVGGITEVHDTRARHAATRAGLLQARSQLRLARKSLQRLVQAEVGKVTPLAEGFEPTPPEPNQPQPWIEMAEQQSRQVRLAELALEAAGAGVDAARAQRHPRVDLVANVRRDHQGGNPTLGGIGIETDGAAVGVQVSVPLFLGGSISADVRQSTAQYNASRYQLMDTRLASALAAESAFISLQDATEQIHAFEEALQAAITAEESTRRSEELGQRTTLDLLNVQRERYHVERDLAAARYQYLLTYLQLRTAVGDPVDQVVRDMTRMLTAQQQVQIEPPPDPS